MFNDYFRLCHSYSTHHTMVQAPPAPIGPPTTGVSKCSMNFFFGFCNGYPTQMFKSKPSIFSPSRWFSKPPPKLVPYTYVQQDKVQQPHGHGGNVSKCLMIIFDFVTHSQ